MGIRAFIQDFVIASGLRRSFSRRLYGGLYAAALEALKRLGARLPIEAVYLRQGLLDAAWTAGASDVDTLWVLRDGAGAAAGRLLRRLAAAKLVFPFLGEAEIAEERHLGLYLREGDAKRRSAPEWRRLAGRDALRPPALAAVPVSRTGPPALAAVPVSRTGPPAASPVWRSAWDAWTMAAESYELLLKCFFSGDGGLAVRVAARKHFIDVHRWLGATEGPPPGRDAAARALRAADGRWGWTERADGFPWSDFPAVLGAALERLTDGGIRAAAALPPEGPALKTWRSEPLADAWEGQAAASRLRRLRGACGGVWSGLVWNTSTETVLLLERPLPAQEAAGVLARLRDFRGTEAGLRGTLAVYPRALFQRRLWSLRHGTPFSFWSLQPGAPTDPSDKPGLTAWRYSARPLFARVFGGRIEGSGAVLQTGTAASAAEGAGDWRPPPAPLLRVLARQAAANWLLRWRAGPGLMPRSPALYRWQLLLCPLLSLRLYFADGRAGDPADLPGLLREYGRAFPDEKAWTEKLEGALSAEDGDWTPARAEALFRAQAAGFERAAGRLAEAVEPEEIISS